MLVCSLLLFSRNGANSYLLGPVGCAFTVSLLLHFDMYFSSVPIDVGANTGVLLLFPGGFYLLTSGCVLEVAMCVDSTKFN